MLSATAESVRAVLRAVFVLDASVYTDGVFVREGGSCGC